MSALLELTEAESAELARWHIGKLTVPDWLAFGPDCWPRIDPVWRRAIVARLTRQETPL